MTKVCSIWVVHNEHTPHLEVFNQTKLVPQEKDNKMEAEPEDSRNGNPANGGDSDIVIFGEEESPDLEIIEPLKRERAKGEVEVRDELKKKKKL